jgi:outer membrane PBP1 activator LpoA protein
VGEVHQSNELITPDKLSRAELLHTSVKLAQKVVASAYEELSELLGDEANASQVQKYVDKKLNDLFAGFAS